MDLVTDIIGKKFFKVKIFVPKNKILLVLMKL